MREKRVSPGLQALGAPFAGCEAGRDVNDRNRRGLWVPLEAIRYFERPATRQLCVEHDDVRPVRDVREQLGRVRRLDDLKARLAKPVARLLTRLAPVVGNNDGSSAVF